MQVLVTGATGTVGHPIARELVQRGDDVRALVRPGSDPGELPAGVTPVDGDLTRPDSLPEATDGCVLVFHAAGLPEQFRRDPRDFEQVNHRGTANLLAAAAGAGVGRVVHTSTMDVFRKGADGRLRESQPDPEPKPTAYERSKVAAEREVDRYVDEGLDVVVVNPASVYGPSPKVTGMAQLFVRVARRQAPLLPPGGMSVVYNEALADAHLAAAERGGTGERYLVADTYASVRDLAAYVVAEVGLTRVPRVAPAWLLRAVAEVTTPLGRTFGFQPLLTPGELHFLLWEARVDATKAVDELGYEPVPLEFGIRRTVDDLRGRGVI